MGACKEMMPGDFIEDADGRVWLVLAENDDMHIAKYTLVALDDGATIRHESRLSKPHKLVNLSKS